MNLRLYYLIHKERPYKRYYYQPLTHDNCWYRALFALKSTCVRYITAVRLPFNSKYNRPQFPGERKSKFKMVCENLAWVFKYKEVCNYYFLYGLDLKCKNPNDYMAYTEFRVIRNILNIRQRENVRTSYTFNYLALVRDKFLFYQYCKSLGMPFPKTIALLSKGRVSWYDGKNMEWSDFETIPTKNFCAFCKEVTGEGGKGAFVLEVNDGQITISGKVATLDELKNKIGNSTYILQEKLINHSTIRAIYPNALNTLRLHTILNEDGTVDFFSAVHRFGANGSLVDNGCHGGMFVGVNEKGILNDYGCYEPHTNNVQLIVNERHQNTNEKFAGMQLPFWNEILSTAKTFHKFMYGIPSIGWDIAITEDGFCFTEAGEDWEIAFDQAANGPQRNHFYKTHGYALDIKLRKY